jgi:hypothetical protein
VVSDADAGAGETIAEVAVDDRDLDGRRTPRRRGDVGRGTSDRRLTAVRPRRPLVPRRSCLVVRPAAGGEQGEGEQSGDSPHASGAIASSACSRTGSSVPPTSSRITCEKYRVITTPSLKSPKRGSGRSPFASASASSG